MKTCAFTGHRPQNLPFKGSEKDTACAALKKALHQEIVRLIQEEGVTHFITGMALGVDMYAAESVLLLKQDYPALSLEAAIPCETQSKKWPAQMQARYANIRNQCDKVTVLQQEYTQDCMHRRNRYMADKADILLAVWNGKPGGTGKTVQYAQKQKKHIIVLEPETLEIKTIKSL